MQTFLFVQIVLFGIFNLQVTKKKEKRKWNRILQQDIFDYTYVKSDHDKPKNSTYSMKNNWNLLFELLYCLCMLTEELQGLK